MLTWHFKAFARFLILHVEALKCALRRAIPQFLVVGIVLHASYHVFLVPFKDLLVLFIRVSRT